MEPSALAPRSSSRVLCPSSQAQCEKTCRPEFRSSALGQGQGWWGQLSGAGAGIQGTESTQGHSSGAAFQQLEPPSTLILLGHLLTGAHLRHPQSTHLTSDPFCDL